MKALTIRQPWATLIAIGVKTIETRSWKAPDALIGERIAIHAGAFVPRNGMRVGGFEINRPRGIKPCLMDFNDDGREWTAKTHVLPLPLGAVMATATLSGCWQMTDGFDWATMPESGVLDLGDNPESGVPNALTLYGRGDNEAWDLLDFTEERPYGHYEPGRWAWYLTDVNQIDPSPAKGRLGLWEWTP